MQITNVKKSVVMFVVKRPKLLKAYFKLRTPSSTAYQSLMNGTDADVTSVRKRLRNAGRTKDYSEPYDNKK